MLHVPRLLPELLFAGESQGLEESGDPVAICKLTLTRWARKCMAPIAPHKIDLFVTTADHWAC